MTISNMILRGSFAIKSESQQHQRISRSKVSKISKISKISRISKVSKSSGIIKISIKSESQRYYLNLGCHFINFA